MHTPKEETVWVGSLATHPMELVTACVGRTFPAH